MFMIQYYRCTNFRSFCDVISISDKEKIETRINKYDCWIAEISYPNNQMREMAQAVDKKLANFVFFDPRDLNCACYIARSWRLTTDDDLTSLVRRLNTARLMITQNPSSNSQLCWWGSNIAITSAGIQILDGQPSIT